MSPPAGRRHIAVQGEGRMDRIIRTITLLSQACGIFAAGLIGAAVLVVCHMVFVRYALNHNTIWQTDFTIYSLIAATFIGSPYVLLTRGHVNVDVLPHYLGERARYWLALVSALMALAFCAVMTVLTFQFWHEAWTERWVSDTMWRARLWIPYSSMPVGLGLLSLQYVIELIKLVTGREPPFGIKPGEVPIPPEALLAAEETGIKPSAAI
jgi:TRAP-type C4-dicarboxylate transport system permease small subunit